MKRENTVSAFEKVTKMESLYATHGKNHPISQTLDLRYGSSLMVCLGIERGEGIVLLPDVICGTPLDRGYKGLYNLDFFGAQKDFSAWELQHPDDPTGPVSEAAGYLFSEFNRLGVLEAQFFENDEAFYMRSKPNADPVIRSKFHSALDRAHALAHTRLTRNSKDRDALFALSLASGLQADYAALIEKRNLASLHFTKEASTWAKQLLAVCNDCSDALVATGFSKYIIGSMFAPVRWLLRMGGLPGDKQAGIADLQMTAEHGHYLAPFARVLLAIPACATRINRERLNSLLPCRRSFPAIHCFHGRLLVCKLRISGERLPIWGIHQKFTLL